MNLVNEYMQLDKRAIEAEDQVSEWQSNADEAHWNQCRIAREAVGAAFSRREFATAVGHTHTHINVQIKVWEQFGEMEARGSMSYADAYSTVKTGTPGGRNRSRDLATAKKVLKDPVLAKEVMADPELRSDALVAMRGHAPLRNVTHDVKPAKHSMTMADEQQLVVYAGEAEMLGSKYMTALTNMPALTGNARDAAVEDIDNVLKMWTAVRESVESNVGDAAAEWLATQ